MKENYKNLKCFECDQVVAVVVSFNDAKAIINCVDALINQVGSIIVVDNCSNDEHRSILKDIEYSYINITFIYLLSNFGIGAAINSGLAVIDDKKFNWVLTMDQDSVPSRNMVKAMLIEAARFPAAAFTPLIDDIGHGNKKNEPFEVEYAITSGNLIPLIAFRQLDGLNSELFIDGVDFDFSLRLRKKGYKIICIPASKMEHKLGNLKKEGIKIPFYSNHAAYRRYYITRNLILNFRRHITNFPIFMMRNLFALIISLFVVLIIGPDRFNNFKFFLLGICDGFMNKHGKLNSERH